MRSELEAEFASVPESVRAAREFVKGALAAWGLDASDGTAALLTSELATNAVVHARTSFAIRVEYEAPTVRVRVEDGSREHAARRDGGTAAQALDGRGLMFVDALSDDWGSRMCERGKEVWFALDVRPVEPRRMAGAGRH